MISSVFPGVISVLLKAARNTLKSWYPDPQTNRKPFSLSAPPYPFTMGSSYLSCRDRIRVVERGRKKMQGAQGACLLQQQPKREWQQRQMGPRQLGPALTQTAFISNLLLPSVNLLAKVHLYISFPSNLIYHLLYAYMLWGFLGDGAGGGVFTRNQSTQEWTTTEFKYRRIHCIGASKRTSVNLLSPSPTCEKIKVCKIEC